MKEFYLTVVNQFLHMHDFLFKFCISIIRICYSRYKTFFLVVIGHALISGRMSVAVTQKAVDYQESIDRKLAQSGVQRNGVTISFDCPVSPVT